MLGIPLLPLVLRLFRRQAGSRTDELQLRRELLAHQRRQLVHQHIPDVYAARETFGARFDELFELLVKHDPAGMGATAATNAYYPELTRTVLYRLARTTPRHLPDLLRQEVELWLGSRAIPQPTLSELVGAVWQWHEKGARSARFRYQARRRKGQQ